MAYYFCGVLIFVTFVVDLAVTKFSHPRKFMPTVIWYCVCAPGLVNVMKFTTIKIGFYALPEISDP